MQKKNIMLDFRKEFDIVKIMKRKKVVFGLIQAKSFQDPEENTRRAAEKVERAAKCGAQIICLGELYRAPYFPQQKKSDARLYTETIPGPSTKAFSVLAKKYGVIIIVPIFEEAKDKKYYNTAVVIDHRGKILPPYRKLHIPHDPRFYEQNYFEAGNRGYQVYRTRFGTLAVLICFDQWFPEAARAVKLLGADMIFYPTAIGRFVGYTPPEGDWHEAWELMQRSHAIANSVPVIAVNRVGQEGKIKFWGQSFVSDAFGKISKRASSDREQVLLVSLDNSKNRYIQESWGFLRNRRPDTYRMLTSQKK